MTFSIPCNVADDLIERFKTEGLTKQLVLDAYKWGQSVDGVVTILLDEESLDYNGNVYFIESVIHSHIVEQTNNVKNLSKNIEHFYNGPFLDKWEDELLPEKVYGVAEDFDEFLNIFLNKNINNWSDLPQPKEELNEMLNQIKPYFIGFLTLYTFIYNHKSYDCKTVILSKDELVNYCSNLNNCLLYGVYLLKAPDKFKLRYGQIDE
jgi:hypothetical protein